MNEENIVCLGTNHYGESVWLRDFSWDCGWSWGGGYIGNRSCHYHFDSFYKDSDGGSCNLFDGFKSHFKQTTLTDKNNLALV